MAWETAGQGADGAAVFHRAVVGVGGIEKLIFTLEHKRVNCIPERGMIFLFSWNVSAVVQAQEN